MRGAAVDMNTASVISLQPIHMRYSIAACQRLSWALYFVLVMHLFGKFLTILNNRSAADGMMFRSLFQSSGRIRYARALAGSCAMAVKYIVIHDIFT